MSSNKIDLVLFGARGDLSRRKLFPALFQLDKAELLTANTRIAAIARQELDSAEFVKQIGETLKPILVMTGAIQYGLDSKSELNIFVSNSPDKEQFNALKRMV